MYHKSKNKQVCEKLLDLTDSREAERAKKEPRILFLSYIKKRFGTTKL